MQHLTIPLIYNLFPRLAGPIEQWTSHVQRAAAMGFNWIYINPVNLPGESGSLYSTKDYYRINPIFLSQDYEFNGLERLTSILHDMKEIGLAPMIDLVINHTAIDSPLVADHPDWYMRDEHGDILRPSAVDPDNPQQKTVWEDLAEIDNQHSGDREALWNYWGQLVDAYLALGFEGFRCDAAYKVPANLWQFLIQRARQNHPHAVFWAENLGCTVEQTRELREAGFNFVCNSSKWWNYQDSWCLEQHEEFKEMPSISFPETHDTQRVPHESDGNQMIQRQKYAFAALFSTGVMMPIGYEFGFQKKLHVVDTQQADWEENKWDLCQFISAVNEFKVKHSLFHGEGILARVDTDNPHLMVLERRSHEDLGTRGWIIVNSDSSNSHEISRALFHATQGQLIVVNISHIEKCSQSKVLEESTWVEANEVVVILEPKNVCN